MASLIVIGGGMTGLAAAYLAAKSGTQVTILEASGDIGGLLQTFVVGSSRLEYFYHHHFREDTELFWLLKELGIEDKLKFHPTTMGIYRGGKHYNFNGPMDLLKFKPLKFLDKVRFVFTSLYLAKCAKWEEGEETSSIEWFRRFSGKSTAECIWEPMHRIKFGDYTSVVPLTWMIGRMRQRLNSRKGTQETLGYMEGSLDTLLQAIKSRLLALGVRIVCKAAVQEIRMTNGKVESLVAGGTEYRADKILATLPTNVLAPMLEKLVPEYAEKLKKIEYFGAVCVVLETTRPLSSIYWLNVADPGFPFGGIIEHTNLIPQERYGRHVAYLSRYFELSNPLASRSDDEIKREFVSALKKIYPDLRDEEILKVHCFRTRSAAVVVDLNFSKKVPLYKTPLENLYLCSMPHLYPDERSVNNSIRIAANALKAMGFDTSAVPQGTTLAGKLG